ncbi:prohead protease/major capsid protein fusion protein [uncultured Cohaesibacter sp.]|uniref:prohead protease/major capsid protein fusion protein n=1 Tax=uncultured Cohaesibacter sp. TaxID=1002546 RepID=UPI0029C60A7A|nr:prohead protease/major capsid protein fusion protein [uncultured Cohaesibacter sp.]
MPDRKTFELPMQTRGAADDVCLLLRAESVNEDERTIDLIWTAGARVTRRGYMPDGEYGRWIEELEVSTEAINLDRLNSGAPLLKNHWAYELNDQMGVVVEGSARIEGKQGVASVRLSARDDVEPHWRDIKSGILSKISVGYSVQEYAAIREDGKLPVFRATRWTPMELSFVLIPADNAAQTRAEQGRVSPCAIISNRKGADMPAKAKTEPGQETAHNSPDATRSDDAGRETVVTEPSGAAPATDTQPDSESIRRAALDYAREVRSLCNKHGLSDEQCDKFLERGLPIEEVRKSILDHLADQSDQVQIRSQRAEQSFSHDDPAVVRERMAKAIAARCVTIPSEPSAIDADPDAWQKYRGLSMLSMMVELGGKGVSFRDLGSSSGRQRILRAAHTTSDFPILLGEAGNRVLMASYEAHPGTFRMFGTQRNMADFRETGLISFGDVPELKPKNEDGEYERFTLSEGKETMKLATYGIEFAMSEEMIINDDLGAFTDFETTMAERAARFENKLFWKSVFNAKMSDGKVLFHADHKNKAASGAAPTSATLGAGITAMRTQKNKDNESIGVSPSYIVSGSALSDTIERLLLPVQLVENSTTVVTPTQRAIKAVYEPMYDSFAANGWSLFANPIAMAAMAYGWLDGQEGPQSFSKESWSSDGVMIRVKDRFAAAPVDYKGAYHNAGAS